MVPPRRPIRDARSATEKGKGRKNGQKLSKQDKKTTKQKGRSAQYGDYKGEESDAEELGALAQEIHEYARFVKESAHYVSETPKKWCFDSGATSMCTGNIKLFEHMNTRCRGALPIASGTRMSTEGRGVVKFSLPNGSTAMLGGVIYVLGLAENLLSLEALHLAGLESRGSLKGYEIPKSGRVVA